MLPFLRRLFPPAPPPYRRRALLTANEIEFFWRLRRALPDLLVFPQVSMGTLIDADSLQRREQFSRKIVDFVVCRPDMRVLCLIELDDITHDPARDRRRDAITGAAGYATVRYHSRRKPDAAEIAETVGRLAAEKPARP